MKRLISKTIPALGVTVLLAASAMVAGCRADDAECVDDGECGDGEVCVTSGGIFFRAGTCLPEQRGDAGPSDTSGPSDVTGDTPDSADTADARDTRDTRSASDTGDGDADAGPTDTGPGPGDFGGFCTTSADCLEGRCERFGRQRLCTRDCLTDDDCPVDGLVCFEGACTPEDFCDYSRGASNGSSFGEGPGCDYPSAGSCRKCDPNASCVRLPGRNTQACLCEDGWVGDGLNCQKDNDGDGLSDARETRGRQTSPSRADTDRDGLDDGEEVHVWRSDPTQLDSDGDYLPDGPEVQRWYTDPSMPDTDGGGHPDGLEGLLMRTDPARAKDDGTVTPSGTGAAATWVDTVDSPLDSLAAAKSALEFESPRTLVHLLHDGPFDFFSGSATAGDFQGGQTPFFQGSDSVWQTNVDGFAAGISGLLYVGPDARETTYAVASQDGHRLQVFSGLEKKMTTKSPGSNGPTMKVGPQLDVDFRNAPSLNSFDLLFYDRGGAAGLEWSSAPVHTTVFRADAFSILPKSALVAPRLKVEIDSHNETQSRQGLEGKLRLTLKNEGRAYAWSILVIPVSKDAAIDDARWPQKPVGARTQSTEALTTDGRDALFLPFLGPGRSVTAEAVVRLQELSGSRVDVQIHAVGAAYPLDEINARRLRNYDTAVFKGP